VKNKFTGPAGTIAENDDGYDAAVPMHFERELKSHAEPVSVAELKLVIDEVDEEVDRSYLPAQFAIRRDVSAVALFGAAVELRC
jgi:hypothetical protein